MIHLKRLLVGVILGPIALVLILTLATLAIALMIVLAPIYVPLIFAYDFGKELIG